MSQGTFTTSFISIGSAGQPVEPNYSWRSRKQTSRADRQAGRQAEKQTDRQDGRCIHTCRDRQIHTYKQTDRPTDRQTDRQTTNKQISKQNKTKTNKKHYDVSTEVLFTRKGSLLKRRVGCTSGGVCVPCNYTHARRELP